MKEGRQYQTATLLPDGNVLVAGGFNSCDDTACSDTSGAELYHPGTGTWTATGAMHLARQQHSATLLPDGDVLVAGGFSYFPSSIGPSGRLDSSAELYDPTTGTWTPTASMAATHSGQTATLLRNGWVLVTGGGTRVAEIYIPQRAVWVSPGTMGTARTDQTATLLPNGNVLVAGGTGAGNPGPVLPTAELFHTGAGPLVRVTPGAITFPSQQVGSTSGARSYTVVNDGSAGLATSAVRVTGANPADFHATTTCTKAPVAPGQSCTVSVRFAPAGTGLRTAGVAVSDNAPLSPHGVTVTGFGGGPNVWAPTSGPMATPREDFAETVLPDGKVLIAGGSNTIRGVLRSAELYNPATRSFSATGSLSTARSEPAAALLPDGQVLVAGGHTHIFADLASAELYNPATGTWRKTTSMNETGHGLTATVLGDGNVLVASFGSGKAEVYHPATATWTDTGPGTAEDGITTATLLPDGKVLATSSGTAAELYDPATNNWTATGSRHVSSFGATATLLPDGEVLLAGGHATTGSFASLADAELYNPATGTWSTAQHMTTTRFGATATLLTSGLAMVAGGCSGQCGHQPGLSSVEVFNGTSWSAIAPMTMPRVFAKAALLPGGDVLVTGGGGNFYEPFTATAEVYTPALLSAQPASGPSGQQVTLSGGNFYAGETVTLTWDGGQVLGHVTTSATGSFTAKITIPKAAPGTHTLAARGSRSAATTATAFTVTG
jgi:WD40 repeat protein